MIKLSFFFKNMLGKDINHLFSWAFELVHLTSSPI